ncbi:hypothetical protein F2P79_016231 [Pimephales promelas]|nr:hypothetical protein F2P79_016231 [Pimephales promelas]
MDESEPEVHLGASAVPDPPQWLQAVLSQQNKQLQHAISPLLQRLEATEASLSALTQRPHASKVTRGPHQHDDFSSFAAAPDRTLMTDGDATGPSDAEQLFAAELAVIDRHVRSPISPTSSTPGPDVRPRSRAQVPSHYNGSFNMGQNTHTPLNAAAPTHHHPTPRGRASDGPKAKLDTYDDYFLAFRFGQKEPPTTARRRLGELRQSKETVSEFAEEVHMLVILAYPGVDTELREQIAADAFLKGLRNQKVAYEVMNRDPVSLDEAQRLVSSYEHNFKATLGRDFDLKGRTRRVSWADQDMDSDEKGTCLTVT